MDKITVIHTKNPERVCKTYTQVGDELEKNVIANIYEGEGKTIAVPDAAKMKSILSKVTERQDIAICAGVWHNAEDGKPFRITTERKLAEILHIDLDKVKGGVIEHKGKLISARLKRGIDYSSWMLLDADNPPGMPDDWAEMSIKERLELWDRIVPNISKCERIELRGSSARVHRIGEAPQANATHAWIKVSDPNKIETLRAYIRVHMVLAGLSFTFNKISKNGGTVVGIEDRSLFDLAVMDSGRLVFCAKPEVISDQYTVADANVTIVNEGAGPLDIGWAEIPNPRAQYDLRQKTGVDMQFKPDGSAHVRGQMSMDTPIEVKGVVRTLSAWAQGMRPNEKLRCEAPFRVSQSEAAFIRMMDNGSVFVHDIGCNTTYYPSELAIKRPDFDYSNLLKNDALANEANTSSPAILTDNARSQNIVARMPTGSFDDWVFLTRRNVFRNVFTGEECAPQSFNLALGRNVPAVPKGDKMVFLPASKYLMNELEGRAAYDTLYVPALATGDPIFTYEGVDYVNSYMLNRVPIADPTWEMDKAWLICERHIKNILPADWRQVICWMAHNVQKPGTKILWSPIIKGIQGDGKTTLARMLAAAMGEQNVKVIGTEEMQSDFNGWAEGACVGVLEEIRIKGHSRHDVMSKLKPLVTNQKISVVRKGQDGRNIPNVTNYLALTNHEDALVLEEDDRRWGVFFTRFKTRQELLEATGGLYWKQLNDAIHNAPHVLRGWLMSIDLSGFDANEAPLMTEAKRTMIQNSKSDHEFAVADILELGAYGVSNECLSSAYLWQAVANANHIPPSPKLRGKILADMGLLKVEGRISWRNSDHRIYVRDESLVKGDEIAKARIRALLDATVAPRDNASVLDLKARAYNEW